MRRQIGVVFQSTSTDKKLTSMENLLYQGAMYGMGGASLRNRATELLARFGVLDRAHDHSEQLSGGLRRRVEIAKGLLHAPNVLMLDEPSAGLDVGARRDLRDVLAGLRKDGTTVLFTTHFMEEAAMCDRVAILDRGKIVALGKPDSLCAESGQDVIKVRARDPEKLRAAVAARFGGNVSPSGRGRTDRAEPGARIRAATRGEFSRAGGGRDGGEPTLEDVFVRRTGRAFAE